MAMNQTIGGWAGSTAIGPGLVDQMVKRSTYTYEDAASAWTAQRERRDNAQRAYDAAMEELASATRAEQEAWLLLERESGRGCPPADCAAPYLPRGR